MAANEVTLTFRIDKEGLIQGVDDAGRAVLEFSTRLEDLARQAEASGTSVSRGFVDALKEGLTSGMREAGASAEAIAETLKEVDEATKGIGESATEAGAGLGKLGEGADEAAQANERLAAAIENQIAKLGESNAQLELAVALAKHVADGTTTAADAEIQLARARAGGNQALADTIEQNVRLKQELAGLEKAARDAAKGADEVGKAAGEAGKKAQEGSGGLKEWVQNALGIDAVFRLWDRGKAILGGIADWFASGISDLSALHDLNRETGISVDMLDRWSIALKASDVSARGFSEAIKGMGQSMAEAEKPGSKVGAILRALDVDLAALKKSNPEEQFLKLGAAVASVEDPMQRQQVAFELYKRGFRDVLRLFGDGVGEIKEFIAYSEALNTEVNKGVVDAADDVGDAMTKLGAGFDAIKQGFFVGLVQSLAPFLDNLSQKLLPVFKTLIELSREFGRWIGKALDDAVPILDRFAKRVKDVGVWQALKEEWLNLVTWLGEQYEKLGTEYGPQLKAAGEKIGRALVDGIKSAIGDQASGVWDSIRGAFGFGAPGAQKHLDELLAMRASTPATTESGAPNPLRANLDAAISRQNKVVNELTESERGLAGADRVLAESHADVTAKTDDATKSTLHGAAAIRLFDSVVEPVVKKNKGLGDALSGAAGAGTTLANEIGRLTKSTEILNAAARNGTNLKDAMREAALATQELTPGMTSAAAAAKQFATEQNSLAMSLTQQNQAADEQIAQIHAYMEALDAGIASGLSYAEAMLVAAEAQAELAAQQASAELKQDDLVAKFLQKQRELRASIAEQRSQAATKQGEDTLANLERQVQLEKDVQAGIISATDAQRQLNIEAAKQQLIASGAKGEVTELATKMVDAQTELKKLQDTAINLGETLRGAFAQTFDAIISGTRSLGEIWEGVGLSLAKTLFDKTLAAKFKFDETFSGNIFDLGGLVQRVLGGSFTDVFSYATSLFGGGSGGGGLAGFSDISGATGFADLAGAGSGSPGLLGAGGGGALGLAANLGIQTGGFFANSNPGLSLGLSGLSLANSGVSLATGGTGIIGSLFGTGASTATLGSLIGPQGSGLVGSLFGETGTSLIGTSLGTIGAVGGGIIGGVGGAYSAFQLGQGNQSAASMAASAASVVAGGFAVYTSLVALVAAMGSTLNTIPIIGTIIYAVVVALAAIAGAIVDMTPTAGTLRRRAGESLLDKTPTFGGLQEQFGDISRSKFALNTNPELPAQREKIGEEGVTDITAFSTIFAQQAFGSSFATGKDHIEGIAQQWTNIITELFSRMEGETDEISAYIRGKMLEAFKDIGVNDATKAFEILNKAAANFKLNPDTFDYFHEAIPGVESLGIALRGIGAIFEGAEGMPAGVHIAALALESMKKEGVAAFASLDTEGHETLVNLLEDTANFDKVVAHLFEQGYEIDTEEFDKRLEHITKSAEFVGKNLGEAFKFDNVGIGVSAVLDKLKEEVQGIFQEASTKQLFEKTNIAAVFEPVYAVLDRIDEFDLTTATGANEFMALLGPALLQGKENLEDYIPILKVLAENWKEIGKIIDEAMKPDDAEKAAAAVEGVFSGMGSLLESSLAAGMQVLTDGGTYDEALGVFKENFAKGAEQALKTAMFNAMVDQVVLAPLLAKWGPALQYVMTAAMTYGFNDPRVQAAWNQTIGGFSDDVSNLAPLVFDAKIKITDPKDEATAFFNAMEAAGKAFNQSLASGLSGLIKESIEIGIKEGANKGKMHFTEGLGDVIYQVVLDALVNAFVQAAIVDNLLGPAIAQGAALYAAAVAEDSPGGRLVTPDEQAGLDEWRTYFQGVRAVAEQQFGQLSDFLFGPGGVLELGGGDGKKKNVIVSGGDIHVVDERQPTGGQKEPTYRPDQPTGPGTHGGQKTGGRGSPFTTVDDPQGERRVIERQEELVDTTKSTNDAMGELGETVVDVTAALRALQDLFKAANTGGAGEDTGEDTGGDDTGTGGGGGKKRGAGDTRSGIASTSSFREGASTADVATASSAGEDFATTAATRTHPTEQHGPGGTTRGGRPVGTYYPAGFRPRGGGSGGWGPGGPVVGPDDPRNPNNRQRAGQIDVPELSVELSDSFKKFAEGGSINQFKKALNEAVADAVMSGVEQGMLESGPLGKAIADMNKQLEAAVEKAMRDGVVTAQEKADLEALAKKLKSKVEDTAKTMKPLLQAIGEAFGAGIEKSTAEAVGDIASGLDSTLRAFFEGGTIGEMEKSVNKAMYDAITSAIIEALITTGPLAKMIDKFGEKFGQALADAMEDGEIDEKEQRKLARKARRFGADLTEAIKILGPIFGPLFEQLAKDFGIDLRKEATSVESVLGDAVRQAFMEHQTFDQFVKNVKQALYANIVDGMVSAFIDSAVINGLLAGPLAVISDVFARIGDHQISVAEANLIILQQLGLITGKLDSPEFRAAFQTFMDGIEKIRAELGITTEVLRDAGTDTATAAEDACTGECAVRRRLVEAELGLGALNELGRPGTLVGGFYSVYNPPGYSGPAGPTPGGRPPIDTGRDEYGNPSWGEEGYWARKARRKAERKAERKARGGPGPGGGDEDDDDGHPPFYGPQAAQTESAQVDLTAEVRQLRETIERMSGEAPAPIELVVTDVDGGVILNAASKASLRPGKARRRVFPREIVR